MDGTPLLSIRCLVYNHEPFLRQCLDGFVMQQTTFSFEAIVHDDASTDGSAAIIREYAEKYPDIIKPIYETENQYSKHDGSLAKIMDAAIHPDSKYIATCEGDDYWTDPNKLQIQVDFLESHPDYYMTCHAYDLYYEETKEFKPHRFVDDLPLHDFEGRKYCTPSIDHYWDGPWFTQPLTIIMRKKNYIDDWKRNQYKPFFDYISCYYMLLAGRCALFKDVMGVYRKHAGGVYSGRDETAWLDECLSNYYVFYGLEKDKKVLPLIDDIFFARVLTAIKQLNLFKLIRIIRRNIKNVSLRHTLYDLWGVAKYMVRRSLSYRR